MTVLNVPLGDTETLPDRAYLDSESSGYVERRPIRSTTAN